jgi:hypothetical protein
MPSRFFVHVTDLHLGCEESWPALEKFVRQVERMRPAPAFVINGGDTIFADMQLTMAPEEAERDFRRYLDTVSELKVPIYNVLGNHDLVRSDAEPGTAEYTKEMYLDLVGPRYMSFDRLGIHFVIVDCWMHTKERNSPEDAPFTLDGIDEEQVRWLDEDLGRCSPGQKVCLLTHHRLRDYATVWDRVRPVLRNDLDYVEIAGCDHQNAYWTDGRWQTYVTGSFAGGWWNGPCIDTSPPGYALVTVGEDGEFRHYYRATDGVLAIASPRWGQTIAGETEVDAIDPASGQHARYSISTEDWLPGWNDMEVGVGESSDHVTVFREPAEESEAVAGEARVEFELVELAGDGLTIECNNEGIGTLEHRAEVGRTYELVVRDGCLKRWNRIAFNGNAVVRSSVLTVGGTRHRDPRELRFESMRPDWFGVNRTLRWDTSLKRPRTPLIYPGSEFFFNVETG